MKNKKLLKTIEEALRKYDNGVRTPYPLVVPYKGLYMSICKSNPYDGYTFISVGTKPDFRKRDDYMAIGHVQVNENERYVCFFREKGSYPDYGVPVTHIATYTKTWGGEEWIRKY